MKFLRKAGPERRWLLTLQLSAMVWNASRAAFDRNYPQETQDQRDLRFMTQCYGRELAEKFIAHRQKVLGPRNETIAVPRASSLQDSPELGALPYNFIDQIRVEVDKQAFNKLLAKLSR